MVERKLTSVVNVIMDPTLKRKFERECTKINKKPGDVIYQLILEYLDEPIDPISLKTLTDDKDSLIEMKGEKIVGVISGWAACNQVFSVDVIFSGGRSLHLSSRFAPWIRTKEETNAFINRELKEAEELKEILKEINIP